MLSYQHAYHAASAADVHKHAALAWMLDYLGRKPKPLRYIETHAGRALYDLAAPEAAKTGEAAAGLTRIAERLPGDHPYARTLAAIRAAHGPTAYPGSPLIAAHLLREGDGIDLAEMHPQEHAALERAMAGTGARIHREDGPALARRLCPPDPARGLCLIDPSYETRDEYGQMAALVKRLAKVWPVGVVVLWYPILKDARHAEMAAAIPDALRHEVRFPPAREGHGMVGSGLIVRNPPFGLEAALHEIESWLA